MYGLKTLALAHHKEAVEGTVFADSQKKLPSAANGT